MHSAEASPRAQSRVDRGGKWIWRGSAMSAYALHFISEPLHLLFLLLERLT